MDCKMGKAKITSGGPAGLYNIELVQDTSRITTEIAAITARLAVLTTAIQDALDARNTALEAVDAALAVLNIAIRQLVNKEITTDEVNKLQTAWTAASKEYTAKFSNHALLILEKESKTKRLALLHAAQAADYRNSVWCADLTENLAANAEVGTIEVNGENTQIIVSPGGASSLTAHLQPVLSSTPAGVFYNRAILPGWQKFKPTFRIGIITSISGNYCNLQLVAALSKEQKLNINQNATLNNVPIEYMSGLNGSAFAVGDRVVIQFAGQSWAAPKVIGFETNPRGASDYLSNYYIFYLDGGTLKIANCKYASGITVLDTKTYEEVSSTNSATPVRFICTRFTHNVPANGVTVARDLYFIATSLYINPNPYTGWVNFAAANPTFPLVTNNANTKITMTDQVRADLNEVNALVNNSHAYVADPEGNDNWGFLADGASGDCENFALEKAKRLLTKGYPASALHIEAARIEGSATPEVGHAWLVVQTTSGDYALDTSSDSIIYNPSLRHSSGEFYCRRRQIGSNWAFISPFGWMQSSARGIADHNDEDCHYYVLDPLLNILYFVGGYASGMENFMRLSWNFSADNNSIYFTTNVAQNIVVTEYKLNENVLATISTLSHPLSYGAVTRDGSWVVFPEPLRGWEAISHNGYFVCVGYPELEAEHNYLIAPPATITAGGKSNPFYEHAYEGDDYFRTPFGETISYSGNVPFMYPWLWSYIETNNVTISAFFFLADPFARYDGIKRYAMSELCNQRLYKNNVSCLPAIAAAIGAAEINILGLVCIPSTDRLNLNP